MLRCIVFKTLLIAIDRLAELVNADDAQYKCLVSNVG